MIRVAVAGAAGRMGQTVCEAVEGAPDMQLVGRADPSLGVELADAADLVPRLLYEEYRARQMFGDRPSLSTYQERYPEHFDSLQQLAHSQPIKVSQSAKYLQVAGGYNLIKRIGSGGFGEVWLAEAPGAIKVAVKTLFRPVDHEEAQREMQALELIKDLRHPFLLQTQQYWASEDKIYIVMELADGSLRERLKQCRQEGQSGIPLPELLQYFREAAEALDFLHSRRVQHRDIKPENILLLQRHAKVADFGLARAQDSQRLMTASGSGTPYYMAPEVWRGKSSIHSDQYGLAATYAELRLDRRLFSSKELAQLMYEHMQDSPNLDPLPEAEQAVLKKALAKEPEDRYPSCTAFVQALEEAAGVMPPRSSPDLSGPASRGSRSKVPTKGPSDETYGTIRPGAQALLESDTPSTGGLPTPRSAEMTPVAPPVRRTHPGVWLAVAGVAAAMLLAVGAAIWFWPKPRPKPWLPGQEWEVVDPEGERVEERFFANRIARLMDGEPVVFVRIPKRPGTDDPAMFYMMENKVWVGLFKKFVAERPEDVPDKFWAEVAARHGSDLNPVLGVTINSADRFARWLGGKLPSVKQWDKAAGFDDIPDLNRGPFMESWDPKDETQIAVGHRDQPREVGKSSHDVSMFGIRDMAGNGREWCSAVPFLRPPRSPVK